MMNEGRLPPNPNDLIYPLFLNGNAGAYVITGESMQPTLWHGQILVFIATQYAADNDIVVVKVGGETLVKRIMYQDDAVLLMSDNPKFAAIHCKHDDFIVEGVGVQILTNIPKR